MHLIAPLMTGIHGAKNGTVFTYERGTTTPAPVYADASGKVRRHGAVRLDALGSVSLYVDRLVDVAVYDWHAALVREWTDGRADGAVIVESDAFTGVDYETGVSAVGERTTMAEAFARLVGSAGALDWDVLYQGAPVPVYAAIGNVAGLFFSPDNYGAVGDGSGDDVAAIQAAIEAARTAGGGVVYLRPGHYMVSTALGLYAEVSLVGAGAGSTFITMTSSGGPALYMFGSSNADGEARLPSHTLAGVTLSANVTTVEPLVYMTSGNSAVQECVFDGVLSTGPLLFIDHLEGCRIGDCRFLIAVATTTAIDTYDITRPLPPLARCYVDGCSFVTPPEHTAARGVVGTARFHLSDCMFDLRASTTGTVRCVQLEGDCYSVLDGCEMTATVGASATLLAMGVLNSAAERIFEDCSVCNNVASTSLYVIAEGNQPNLYYCRLKSVEARHSPIVQDTLALQAGLVHPVAPDASQYGIFSVFNTTASVLGAPDSGLVVGAVDVATNTSNIPLGRVFDVLYFSTNPETFQVLDNRTRMSAMGRFIMKATSVYAFRMMSARVFAQSPVVGEITRLCCLTTGAQASLADPTQQESYGPI